MLGRSYPEYILIRTCIFGFRLIAPLSIAYVVASWYSGKWLLHAYLGYYASLEAIFYLCVYLPRSWLLQEVSITQCSFLVVAARGLREPLINLVTLGLFRLMGEGRCSVRIRLTDGECTTRDPP